MNSHSIVFYISSILMIFFALFSLFAKNVVYSLLSAIFVFFLAGVLFFNLGSEYNAVMQAAVYGLGVPVVLGVSIMFTKQEKRETEAKITISYLTVFCAFLFILASVYLLMISNSVDPETFNISEEISFVDSISVFAKGIFVNYVWAFELVSLILTIVIAGIALITSKNAEKRRDE